MIGADEAITMRGVEKRYGRSRAVRVESLALARGESVVLAGSNGSGKSTLLRLLAGISIPDCGSVRHAAWLQRAPLGYVPQSGGLYPELSLRDNLLLRRQLYGLAPVIQARAWYVGDLGLADLLHKRFGDLSGGFQRLACVSAALHVEPRWLVMDEPFSGVDAERRAILSDRLAALAETLELLVIATPGPEEALDAARIIRVSQGEVQ